jgi:hypothetical protein
MKKYRKLLNFQWEVIYLILRITIRYNKLQHTWEIKYHYPLVNIKCWQIINEQAMKEKKTLQQYFDLVHKHNRNSVLDLQVYVNGIF